MLIFIALSPIAHFMETTDAERALPLVRGERLSGHVLALNVFGLSVTTAPVTLPFSCTRVSPCAP